MPRTACALLAAAILATAALIPAQAAASARRPGDVLVNQPASTVCTGKTFTVGVWYQQFSGNSPAYRVDVYNPLGTRVLYKHGDASASAWRFWQVRAELAGRYHTVYWTHPPRSGKWTSYSAVTRAHRC